MDDAGTPEREAARAARRPASAFSLCNIPDDRRAVTEMLPLIVDAGFEIRRQERYEAGIAERLVACKLATSQWVAGSAGSHCSGRGILVASRRTSPRPRRRAA